MGRGGSFIGPLFLSEACDEDAIANTAVIAVVLS